MPLRRSIVTPRALVARRLNSLKSTGPRTARGKAWSSLNALRHGQRCQRRTFRDKLARTGDSEALHLFDFIFEEILETSECRNERVWCRLRGLAVRAWCIESGRRGRKVAKTALRTKLESGVRIYRYAAKFVVPRRLKITNGLGWGFVLHNPVPSRRRRVGPAWIPEVEYIEGALPQARRVRGGCNPGTQLVRSGYGPSPAENLELGKELEPKQSRWGAILRAVGGIGSSILQGLGGPARRGPVIPAPPSWDQEGPGVVDFSNHHPLFPSSARRGEPVPKPPSWDQEGPGVVDSSSLLGSRLPGSAAATRSPHRPVPPEDFCEDPEDYESESPEEILLRHKFLARLAIKMADRASRKAHAEPAPPLQR